MPKPPPDIDSPEWAWPGLRRDVFQLVAWGYQIEESEIRSYTLEEDITGLIRKGIRAKLDEDLPPRFRCYSSHNEDPEDESDELGKKRPLIDILIESGGSSPRKLYRLEAKRCARKKFNSKYTIDWYSEGITSFVNQRYAKNAPEAGLLGLMQSDDAGHWKQELSKKLKTDKSLSAQSSTTDVELTTDLPDMCSSQHERHDGSLIILYHAFLDCCPV